MNLSIIIVNWNTQGLLAQCLRSIQDSAQSNVLDTAEVLVVDNASTDGSVDMMRTSFPWVHVIENSKNVGFASANNQAIRQSSGSHVLLLNPDTEVLPGALEAQLTFLEAHPDVGAVGPRLLNADRTLQLSCYPAPTLSRELWRLLHLDMFYPYGSYWMQKWSTEAARDVDSIQGACLLIRGDVLQQVGLLDEDYFMYTEEIDLCYRVQRAGWRICWVPSAHVVHYGGQSTKQVAADMFLQLYRSKLMYFRKHYGPLAATGYKFILLISGLARILLSPLAGFEQSSSRQQHEALAKNYRRLLYSLPQM